MVSSTVREGQHQKGMKKAPAPARAADILAWLRQLIAPDQVTELRCLHWRQGKGRPVTRRGFYDFDHLDEMAKEAAHHTRHARGVYFTFNPLHESLLARCCNRTDDADSGTSANDGNVTRRRFLLIDIDPKKDPHVSATDAEKAQTRLTIDAIRDHLTARGWPAPVLGDSGNGYHLFYRIDLDADDEGIVKRILAALAKRFDNAAAAVDQQVFNPSRVVKVPGTLARKGDHTDDRPHRASALLSIPEPVECVALDLLRDLAAEAPEEPPRRGAATPRPAPSRPPAPMQARPAEFNHRLDVERWLADRGRQVLSTRTTSDGRTAYNIECPFDPAHGGTSSAVMQAPNGAMSAQCFHSSCIGRGWQEFKAAIGDPDAHHYEPPLPERQSRLDRISPPPAPVKVTVDAPVFSVPEDMLDPHRLGRRWLCGSRQFRVRGDRVAYYRESFYRWDGRRWYAVADKEVACELTRYLKSLLDQETESINSERRRAAPPGQEVRLQNVPQVKQSLVTNVVGAIRGDVLVSADVDMPTWRGDEPGPRPWLSVENGILDVEALLAGEAQCLRQHDPLWFSTVYLPYPFRPDATAPTWRRFLDRNLGDDPGKARLLQQWAGYLLTPSSGEQKFLMMTGAGANGKSVICAAMSAMLGEANVSSVPLELFGDKFRLAGTLGKLANVVAEVGELDRLAEGTIKAFSSGDPLEFERKFKEPFSARPTARLMLATNTPPSFRDRSDGIWRRLIYLPCVVRIPDGERVKGMDKPEFWASERSGIMNWAIAGLADLRDSNGFVIPESCEVASKEHRLDSSPTRRFLTEHCRAANANAFVPAEALYEAYRRWCRANGHREVSSATLGKEIRDCFSGIERRQKTVGALRPWGYFGLEVDGCVRDHDL